MDFKKYLLSKYEANDAMLTQDYAIFRTAIQLFMNRIWSSYNPHKCQERRQVSSQAKVTLINIEPVTQRLYRDQDLQL